MAAAKWFARRVASNILTLIFGLVVGGVVAVVCWFVLPVVSMQGEIVDRGPGSVVIHIWGEKLRDCGFIGMKAYTLRSDRLHDAVITRIDMVSDNTTKPKGYYDIGDWDIYPVTDDATKVIVYVEHTCGIKDVRMTKIAEVTL